LEKLFLKLKFNNLRIVCNWAYIFPECRLLPGQNSVEWKNWYAGPDSLYWSCCQLVHIAGKHLILDDTHDRFACKINGSKVTLDHVDQSYISMIKDWLQHPNNLGTHNDALAMWDKITGLEQRHGSTDTD
jgi:hypothetical protein